MVANVLHRFWPKRFWGVTGLIGSGKSTALLRLRELGFSVFDTDQIAREILDPQGDQFTLVKLPLEKILGGAVCDESGRFKRDWVREQLQSHEQIRNEIEKLLHPLILQVLSQKVAQSAGSLHFVEGTRLIESGFIEGAEGLLLIQAPADVRHARVAHRAKDSAVLSPEQVRRFDLLQDEPLMRSRATFIVDNSGSTAELHRQLDVFLLAIKK